MKEFDHAGLILCDYQGRIFEDSINKLSCSSLIFFRRYKNSDFLKHLDMNKDYLETFTTSDAFISINEQYGESEYGIKKYDKDMMYWLGYILRYISYTREIKTRILFDIISPQELIKRYHTYHTQSEEWVIDAILKSKNLDESIFDKRKRIETILSKQY